MEHQTLRDAGLRVTAPRVAVLAAVGRLPHATAEAVLTAVRAELPTVSVQAVYDVLHALTGAGLLRCIEPAGHPARYERRVADNHHHVVCRGCGSVADIDCAAGYAPCLEPSGLGQVSPGFVVDEAEVTYWGLCAPCQSQISQADGTAADL